MKKLLTTTIIAAMIASLGAAFAQTVTDTDTHRVEIMIPSLVMIRIMDGTAVAADPVVIFDYVGTPTNQALYSAAVATTGSGSLDATSAPGFTDVRVLANRGTWRVTVSASALTFSGDGTTNAPSVGIALSDIWVAPAAFTATNYVTNRSANWNLGTTVDIASGVRTQGWRSLGFNGMDYELRVHGDEEFGTHTTTVTYTITAP